MSQDELLNITLLASEWKSSAGGLPTLNRELAIHLAQIQNVRVSMLVPEGACNEEDKNEARSFGISILDAKKSTSFPGSLFFPSHRARERETLVWSGHVHPKKLKTPGRGPCISIVVVICFVTVKTRLSCSTRV